MKVVEHQGLGRRGQDALSLRCDAATAGCLRKLTVDSGLPNALGKGIAIYPDRLARRLGMEALHKADVYDPLDDGISL